MAHVSEYESSLLGRKCNKFSGSLAMSLSCTDTVSCLELVVSPVTSYSCPFPRRWGCVFGSFLVCLFGGGEGANNIFH